MRRYAILMLLLALGALVWSPAAQAAPPSSDIPKLSEFRLYFLHLANLDAAADKADADGMQADTDGWRSFEQNRAGLTGGEGAILKDVAYRCNQALQDREAALESGLEVPGFLDVVRESVEELETLLGPAAFESVSRRIVGFLRPAIAEVPLTGEQGLVSSETLEPADDLPVETESEIIAMQVLTLVIKMDDGSFVAQCATTPNDSFTNQYYNGVTYSCTLRGTGGMAVPVACVQATRGNTCIASFGPAPPGHQRWTEAVHGVRMGFYDDCRGTGVAGYLDQFRYCHAPPYPHFVDIDLAMPLGGAVCLGVETCQVATSNAYPITYLDINPRQATITAGAQLQFSTSLDMQASWSVVGGPGTIDHLGLYKAPGSVESQQTATIKACDLYSPRDCVTAAITVTPLTVTVSPTNRALPPTANLELTATIVPSSAGQEIEWTATPELGILHSEGNNTVDYTVFRDDLIDRTTEVTIKACLKPALTACGTAKVTVEKLLFMVTAPITKLAPGQSVQVTAFVGDSSVPRNVVWTDPPPGQGTLSVINSADPFIRLYTAPPFPIDFGIQIEACLEDAPGFCAYRHIDLGSELTIDDISSDTGRWQAGVLTPFTITGTGFTGATQVFFGDLDVTLTSVTDTAIRGKVNIVVPATTLFPKLKQTYPGGGGKEITRAAIPVEPATVSVVPPSAQVQAGGTVNLAASCLTSTVQGCTSLEVPTWSVSPLGTGTITGPGMLATYTAPTSVQTSTAVTISACWRFGDLSRCVPAQVTVQPNGPIVAVNPKTASLQPGQTQPFTAQVTYHTNTAVTWSATAGDISSSGLYTAPATFTGPATVTVTATSVADSSRKDTATVTLVPAPLSVTSNASPPWAHHGTTISWTATASGGTPGTIQYALFRRKQGTTNWVPLLTAGVWQSGNVLTWAPASTDVATWEIRVGVRDANNAGPILHDPGSVQVIAPLSVTCPSSPASVNYGTPVTWTVPTSGGLPGTIQYALFRRRAGTTPWTPDVNAPAWQSSNVLSWAPAAGDVGSWDFYLWVKDGTTPPNANSFGYTFGCSLGTVQVLAGLTVTSTASPVSVNHGTAITWTATANGGSGTGRQYAVVRKVAGSPTWSAPAWQTSNVLGWTPGPADVNTWDIAIWVKDSLTPAGSSFGASYNPGQVRVLAPLTVSCSASPAYVNPGTAISWTATANGGDPATIRYAFFRKKTGATSWIPDITAPSWQASNTPTWTPASTDVGTWEFSIWVKDANTPANANTYGFAGYCNPGPTQVVAPLTLTSTPSPAAAYSGQPITWTLSTTGGVPGTIQFTWSRRRTGSADWISSPYLPNNVITWTPSSTEAGATWEIAFTVKDSLTTPTQNTYGYAAWHNPGSVQVVTPLTVTGTTSPATATHGNQLTWTATASGGTGVGRQYAFFRKRPADTVWTPAVTSPAWQSGNVMSWTPAAGDVGTWDTYVWVKDSATPPTMNTYGHAAWYNSGTVQIVGPLGVTSTASPALATYGNAIGWTATATGGVPASTQFAVVRRKTGTTPWSAPVWQSSGSLSWTPASTDVGTWEISIQVRDGNTPAGAFAASYNPGSVQVVAPLSVTGTGSPSAFYHSNPITWTATGSGGTGSGRQYAFFRKKVGTTNWIPAVTSPAWQSSAGMSWTPGASDVGTWETSIWFKDANTPANANGYGYGAYYNPGPVQVYAHPTVSGTGSPSSVNYGTTITWTASGSGGIGSAKQYALFRKKVGTSNWIPALTSPGWQPGNVLSWTPGSADVGTWEIFVWMKDANTPSTMNTYGHAAWYNAGAVEVTGPLSLTSCTPSPVSSNYNTPISWTAYASGGHAPTIQYALFRKKVGTTTWIPAQTSPAWQSGSVMTWTPGSGDVGSWETSIWVRDGNTASGYAASCSPGTVQVTAPLGLSVTGTPSSSPYGTTITWTAYASGGHPPTTRYAFFRRPSGSGNSGWIPSIYSPAWQTSNVMSWTPGASDVGSWDIYVWVKDGSTPPTQNTYGYAAGANGGSFEVTAPIYQYSDPIGWVDGVDNQWIWGWACDPDYPWESNRVDLWTTSWQYLGSAEANGWSSTPINNACGGGSAHYFSFYHGGSIPSGTHFWVWSIDLPYGTPNGVNVPIGGSGGNEFVMP